MKVVFQEGFKLNLITETELERIFMMEWQKRSRIYQEDLKRMNDFHLDPRCIDWEFQKNDISN